MITFFPMKPRSESQLKLILKHKQVQKAHASKFFLHLFNTYGINRRAKYLLIIRLSFVSPKATISPLYHRFLLFSTPSPAHLPLNFLTIFYTPVIIVFLTTLPLFAHFPIPPLLTYFSQHITRGKTSYV